MDTRTPHTQRVSSSMVRAVPYPRLGGHRMLGSIPGMVGVRCRTGLSLRRGVRTPSSLAYRTEPWAMIYSQRCIGKLYIEHRIYNGLAPLCAPHIPGLCASLRTADPPSLTLPLTYSNPNQDFFSFLHAKYFLPTLAPPFGPKRGRNGGVAPPFLPLVRGPDVQVIPERASVGQT